MQVDLLLVDDKPENLVALEELLRRPDRRLFKATSGNDALRLLLRHDFAVVLLDVEMPGMDGYETAQLMRSAERTKLVPIIFVTAGDRAEERTFRGYAAGAVDFLYKPLEPHVLQSKVDIFVDIYRKTRELQTANAVLSRTTAALRDRVADLEDVNRSLSHDLRAPLRAIRAFSADLADSLAGKLDPEAQDRLDRVVRAADRMGGMIDGLFALLKLSALEETGTTVELERVLAEVLEDLRLDLEQAGGAVTHDRLPALPGHPGLYRQIFQNLIANALKFRDQRPPAIHVSARREGDHWTIGVLDNGTGIAPEHREDVFALFHRLGRAGTGTGVGLALCKRAVDKLGGTIWVDAAPGGGAAFYFTVPR